MSTHFMEELTLYLKAEYPLIFVQTQEEYRARKLVEQAVIAAGFALVIPRTRGHFEPVANLLKKVSQDGAVLLLDTVHRQLNEAETIRALADFSCPTSQGPKSAVILTPWLELPPELERQSAMCRLPLPTPGELEALVESVCQGESWKIEVSSRPSLVRAAQGLSEDEATRALRKALIGWPTDIDQATESIFQDKRRSLKRARVLEDIPLDLFFDDVGGLDRLKEWLGSRKDAFTPRAREYGLPTPKGVLLTGVQGCGKSISAKAIAGYWNLPLVRLDLPGVFGSEYPENALKNALGVAEAMAPVVLWIDEIEKGFDSSGRGQAARLLGGMITWLQEKVSEVFVVATANRVAKLPPELPRKGRFDEIFFVDLPDFHERYEILKLHVARRGKEPREFSLEKLAKKAEKFTGSELEQVIISAMYASFSRGEELTDDDLNRALGECIPLYDTFEEEIKALREWARKRARSASTNRKKIDLFAQS